MFDFNNYVEFESVVETIDYLVSNENAVIISGGTDLLIKLRDLDEKFIGKDLVSIKRIPELKEIKLDEEGNVIIGSVASFTDIENNEIAKKYVPFLVNAVKTVGGPQIRNMGTIGGNVCNGATSADSAATLFALNAILLIEGKDGKKEVSILDFYKGPGKVDLKQGDILTSIKIKSEDYENFAGHYIKYAQRNAMDIANIACSILIKVENNIISDLRIAYGVAGPIPLRAKVAEEFAKNKEISDELLNEIGKKCLEDTKARDSWRASKEFRDHLISELPKRAIKTALGRDEHV